MSLQNSNIKIPRKVSGVTRQPQKQSKSSYTKIVFNEGSKGREGNRAPHKPLCANIGTIATESNLKTNRVQEQPQRGKHMGTKPPSKRIRKEEDNNTLLEMLSEYDGTNMPLAFLYETLIRFLEPYGVASILEIFVTFFFVFLLVLPFYHNTKDKSFDLSKPNGILLQEDNGRFSGGYISEELPETEPVVTGIMRYKNKVTIVMSMNDSKKWQERAARQIESIIHTIIETRTEELFNVEGKDIVFCVQVKDVIHYSCILPYDAIRGYTRDNSRNVNFVKQLKYYGGTV